jgi:hypothetical protein
MRRSRWAALAVLLAVAAVLLVARRGHGPSRARVTATAGRLRDRAAPRLQRREAPAPPHAIAPGAAPAPAEPAAPPPRRRDSLLTALPVKPDAPVIVFEVNALRNSPFGERFLSCVKEKDRYSPVVRAIGIDPLVDIDRVAFLGDATVVSGTFARAHWNELGSAGEPYGQGGRIYTTPDGALGTWGDQIVVLSSRSEDIRTAIDQLEGRAATPDLSFPDEMSYGEIYGLVPGAAARRMLGGDANGPGLTDRLGALASRIELHVDAMQDLSADLRIKGDDAAGLSDLASGLGAALAAVRSTSQSTGDKGLSALLAKAAVRPSEGGFSIHLDVPATRMNELLGDCKIFAPPAPREADDHGV